MILGIGHESRVGKDTFTMFLFDYLRGKYRDLKLVREGFADNLYDVCYIMYKWAGFQQRQYYVRNPHAKEVVLPLIGKTPRDLLIGIGNACREFDSNCWLAPVTRENTKGFLKIVPDLRKVNEFQLLKAGKHFCLRITRKGFDSDRESDVDLLPFADQWDHTIYNDGDLNSFQQKAIEFADTFIVPRITAGL